MALPAPRPLKCHCAADVMNAAQALNDVYIEMLPKLKEVLHQEHIQRVSTTLGPWGSRTGPQWLLPSGLMSSAFLSLVCNDSGAASAKRQYAYYFPDVMGGTQVTSAGTLNKYKERHLAAIDLLKHRTHLALYGTPIERAADRSR